MNPYWPIAIITTACWTTCAWLAFVAHQTDLANRHRRNAEMFRRMEADAVSEARRLTAAERVEILGEVWL